MRYQNKIFKSDTRCSKACSISIDRPSYIRSGLREYTAAEVRYIREFAGSESFLVLLIGERLRVERQLQADPDDHFRFQYN